MAGVTIRPARPGDGHGLVLLHLDTAESLRQLDPSRFRIPDVEGFAEWLDAELEAMGTTRICFVAEEDGQVLGQVEANIAPPMASARYQTMTKLGSPRGEGNSLGVLSARRRRGIATALMAEAEKWLWGRGVRVIHLDTFIRSPDSVPFYDALGYTRTGIIFERAP